MILVLCYGFDSRDNFFYKLNQYNEFALKYMLFSSLLAAAEPYAEQLVRSRVAVKVNWSGFGRIGGRINSKLVVGVYAAVLFLLNLIRIFDNNFWGDEAYSLLLVKKTIPEIIRGYGRASGICFPINLNRLSGEWYCWGRRWSFCMRLRRCGLREVQKGKQFCAVLQKGQSLQRFSCGWQQGRSVCWEPFWLRSLSRK